MTLQSAKRATILPLLTFRTPLLLPGPQTFWTVLRRPSSCNRQRKRNSNVLPGTDEVSCMYHALFHDQLTGNRELNSFVLFLHEDVRCLSEMKRCRFTVPCISAITATPCQHGKLSPARDNIQHAGGIWHSVLKTTRFFRVASLWLVTVASIMSEPSIKDTDSWKGLAFNMRFDRWFSMVGGTGAAHAIAFFSFRKTVSAESRRHWPAFSPVQHPECCSKWTP